MGATKTVPTVLVSDIMVQKVKRVTPDMKLREVAELMIRHKVSGAPIVDGLDRVLSVIGEGDTLRLAASEGVEATIAHCLQKLPEAHHITTLKPDNTFADAYRAFLINKIHRIPIVDDGFALKGLVTRTTILQLFVEAHYGKKMPTG